MIGLMFGSYESVCIIPVVIVTLPKFASDELTV